MRQKNFPVIVLTVNQAIVSTIKIVLASHLIDFARRLSLQYSKL